MVKVVVGGGWSGDWWWPVWWLVVAGVMVDGGQRLRVVSVVVEVMVGDNMLVLKQKLKLENLFD